MLQRLGVEAIDLGVVRDDPQALRGLRQAAHAPTPSSLEQSAWAIYHTGA